MSITLPYFSRVCLTVNLYSTVRSSMSQHLRIQCTKFFIKKRNNCRKNKMLWHGIPNGCGLLPPEDKKLICGMEGENVVAYGRQSFPVPCIPKRIYDLAKLSNIFHFNPADYAFLPYLIIVFCFLLVLFFSQSIPFYF